MVTLRDKLTIRRCFAEWFSEYLEEQNRILESEKYSISEFDRIKHELENNRINIQQLKGLIRINDNVHVCFNVLTNLKRWKASTVHLYKACVDIHNMTTLKGKKIDYYREDDDWVFNPINGKLYISRRKMLRTFKDHTILSNKLGEDFHLIDVVMVFLNYEIMYYKNTYWYNIDRHAKHIRGVNGVIGFRFLDEQK